jgi:hypothetical protein
MDVTLTMIVTKSALEEEDLVILSERRFLSVMPNQRTVT